MAEEEKKYIVVLEPISELTEELLTNTSKADETVEVVRVSNAAEATQIVSQYIPCVVIAGLTSSQSIVQVINLFKSLMIATKEDRIKSMIISKFKSPQLRTVADTLFVSEYVEEPIPGRTLQFKLNLHIRAIEAFKKKEAQKKLAEQEQVFGKDKGGANQANKDEKEEPHRETKALKTSKDCFVFGKNSKVKKKRKKFVIEMEGPDPESGQWKEHESEEEGGTAWRWCPDDPEAPENKAEDPEGWVHEGDKPVFNKKTKKWSFASEKPSLAYKAKKKKQHEKVSTSKKGEIEIAEDSEEAIKKQKEVRKKLEERENKNLLQTNKKQKNENEDPKDNEDKNIESNNDNKKQENKDSLKKNKDEKKDLKNLLNDKDKNNKSSENKENGKKSLDKSEKEKNQKDNKDNQNKNESLEDKNNKELTRKEKLEQKHKEHKEKLKKKQEELKKKNNDIKNKLKEEEKEDKKNKLKSIKKEGKKSLKKSNTEKELEKHQSGSKSLKATKEDGIAGKLKKPKLKTDEEIGKEAEELEEEPENKLNDLKEKFKKQKRNAKKLSKNLDKKSLEKAKDKVKKKNELLAEIEKEANKKPKKKLTKEERKKLEEELGEDASDLDDEELGKKAKKKKLKKLMKDLDETDKDIGDILADAEEGDQKNKKDLKIKKKRKDKKKKKEDDKGFLAEEDKGINAHDSDIEEDEVDWKAVNDKKKKDNKNRDVIEKNDRLKFFKTNEELDADDCIWEKAEESYAFISSEIKYKGFDDIEEAFPLWIYQGEDKPEFIPKENSWRFYDEEPVLCESSLQAPIDVRDYLHELNEIIKGNIKKPKTKEEEKAEEEKKEKLEKLKNLINDKDEKPASEEVGEEFDLKKYKEERKKELEKLQNEFPDEAGKLKDEKKKAALDELDGLIGKKKEENDPDASTDDLIDDLKANKDKIEETANDIIADLEDGDPLKEEAKKKLEDLKKKLDEDNVDESTLEEAKSLLDTLNEAEDARKKSKEAIDPENLNEKNKEETESKDEPLSSLGSLPPEAEKDAQDKGVEEEDISEKKNGEEASLEELKKKKNVSDNLADRLEDKNKEASEFLKKRKEAQEKFMGDSHKERLKDIEEKRKNAKSTPESDIGSILALNLFISDAIFDGKGILSKIDKLCELLANAYCSTRATMCKSKDDDEILVLGCSDEKFSKDQIIKFEEFNKNKISANIMDDENKILLGILVLEVLSPRTEYTDKDQKLLDKIVKLIAKYWKSVEESRKGRHAA